jgi:outer membrane protein assembly factor BamB
MTDGTDEFGNIAIDGPMIYANTLSTHLLAIRSLSGTLAWDENVAEEDSQFPSSIVNNTIYVGLVALSAINAQNGKVLWQYLLPPQTGIKTTPVVAGGTVYFGTMALQTKQPEQLIAVDATTGKKRWALSLKSTGLRDVVVGGGVIMLSGMDLSTETGWVDAVNAQNGHLLWQKPFSPDLSAPIEADGILYITEDIFSSDGSDNTTLDAINIHTGTVEWSIAGAEPSLFVSGILYSIDAAGRIVARSTINGHVLWQAQLQMPLLVGSPTRLVLLDGEIFVGMRYLNGTHATFFLDAFNLNTHQEDWYANITGIETSTGSNISVAV